MEKDAHQTGTEFISLALLIRIEVGVSLQHDPRVLRRLYSGQQVFQNLMAQMDYGNVHQHCKDTTSPGTSVVT